MQGIKIPIFSRQRFGKLETIKVSKKKHAGGVLWDCICDCGNIIHARSSDLVAGKTKSCTKCPPNILYTANYAMVELNCRKKEEKPQFAYISLCDTDKIMEYNWSCTQYGYARNGKTGIFMHRLILKPSKGMFIDHVNRNKLDNRRTNLRICTEQENSLNKASPCTSLTGYKGISFSCNKKGGFQVQVGKDGKYYTGGKVFYDLKEAIEKANELLLKYHGRFAVLNKSPY